VRGLGWAIDMTELKLGRLPDRTPVKMTVCFTPDINALLIDYAIVYKLVHGQDASVAELIPHMLSLFLTSDRGFQKAREDLKATTP